MKRFKVVVTDTGQDVWSGEAEHALDAAERAVRGAHANVGRFVAYSFGKGGEFDLRHLVVRVYDCELLAAGDPTDPDTAGFLGTYAARYLD
jgi:hypothetical protein